MVKDMISKWWPREDTRLLLETLAESWNSLIPKCARVSAINSTAKTIFERLYLVLGLTPIYAPSQMCLSTHRSLAGTREDTGTRPDYFAIRADQKNDGPRGCNVWTKRQKKSIISHRVSGGGSASTQTVDAGNKCSPSWNQIQSSCAFFESRYPAISRFWSNFFCGPLFFWSARFARVPVPLDQLQGI